MLNDSVQYNSPIFVGGTGRCGTTIMGKYLNSHSEVVRPVSENKLIVEDGGLRTLIDNLSRGFDYKSNHNAISYFIDWTKTLRSAGFRNKPVNFFYRVLNRLLINTIGKGVRREIAARKFSFLSFSLKGIGAQYGCSLYDRCIAEFLGKVIGGTDTLGIVDTEGEIKPVYMSSTNSRAELLQYARDFLAALNINAVKGGGASRWCDATPLNACYAEFLLELYPFGKCLHVVRDPRDVAASYIERSWVSNDLDLMLDRLQRHYAALITVEQRVSAKYFKTIRLEDMTLQFNRLNQELCEFLHLSPDGFDGSVSFESSSFGRWNKKFSRHQQQRVEDALKYACVHYGYA